MGVQELLTQRFIKAIQDEFKPCPLIGPKWFQYHEKADPPYFQFAGVKRLAKAAGMQPRRVAELVLENLNANQLDANVKLTDDLKINVVFNTLPDQQ